MIKHIGHITGAKLQNDVSNFLLFNFVRFDFYKAPMKPCKSQKALRRKDYLLASSIATATATVIPTMGLLQIPINLFLSHLCRRASKIPLELSQEVGLISKSAFEADS